MAERGIWWQVAGFALIGCASLAILQEFAGSEARAYQYFDAAVTRLYWAFVIPLAGLFDGVRRMFEKRSEIRRAVREKIREEGRAEGREEGREEGRREEKRRLRNALRDVVVQEDSAGATTLNITREQLESILNGEPE